LIVEHGNFNTASFDAKNRVLRLPIWKEMSGSLYDLLVLHEVGHALFTPEEGLHDAKDHGKGFKSFLNVVISNFILLIKTVIFPWAMPVSIKNTFFFIRICPRSFAD